MNKKKTELRFYRESDWENVKNFLHNNWRKNHPLCRKDLFDWQHKGFGYEKDEVSSIVLLHNDEIVGFRGVIPGLYQIPFKNDQMKIIKGASCPMWMVKKEFRGFASFKMYLKTLNMFPVITAGGINVDTAMKFHKRNAFTVLNAVHRYILPLNEGGYQKLLLKNVAFNEIKNWVKKISKKNTETLFPSLPEINKMAELWEKSTFPDQIFSLYRNADFWRWRYLESKGFNYIFFGDPEYDGIIVARVEKIITDEPNELTGQNVLRIIEIIPAYGQDRDKNRKKLITLITGVLHWAVKQECLMADFQCSSRRYDKTLDHIGFKEQNLFFDKPIFSVPTLFQPLRYQFPPINMGFRIDMGEDKPLDFNWDDTYMVKSESDQDRPNV